MRRVEEKAQLIKGLLDFDLHVKRCVLVTVLLL